MSDIPTNEELPMDRLAQLAMWGYIDQAQANGHAHDRLSRASRAAAQAVVGTLREMGYLRHPLQPLSAVAAHGTPTGAKVGCTCDFCKESASLYARALYHYNKIQGDNKVRL